LTYDENTVSQYNKSCHSETTTETLSLKQKSIGGEESPENNPFPLEIPHHQYHQSKKSMIVLWFRMTWFLLCGKRTNKGFSIRMINPLG